MLPLLTDNQKNRQVGKGFDKLQAGRLLGTRLERKTHRDPASAQGVDLILKPMKADGVGAEGNTEKISS